MENNVKIHVTGIFGHNFKGQLVYSKEDTAGTVLKEHELQVYLEAGGDERDNIGQMLALAKKYKLLSRSNVSRRG